MKNIPNEDKLVRDVITEGLAAFDSGVDFHACPYEPDDPVFIEGTHGGKPIGRKRVGIDWQQIWEIGWNIGDYLARATVQTRTSDRVA